MVIERDNAAGTLGLDLDRGRCGILVVGDGGEHHLAGLGGDVELNGRVGLSDRGDALERGGQGGDVDLDRGGTGRGQKRLVVGVHALDAAGDVGGVARHEHDLRIRGANQDGALATGDGERVVEGVGGHVQLKAAFQRGGLDLSVAHGQTVGVCGNEADRVVLDGHVHAVEDRAVLVRRGNAPDAADHLGQDVGGQLDRALEGERGELGEVAGIERVQTESGALTGDSHLALGQLKGHRRIRQGLDDVEKHLAGNDDLSFLVHASRDAVADRDSVVRRLELKDPVGGADEHAGEDGERR